jgi:molybdopterin biosynthesis enzyme
VTFNLFARTALLTMQRAQAAHLETGTAVLADFVKGAAERESYLPAKLHTDENGVSMATPLKWGGSSDFIAFARATALVVVPADVGRIESGSRVRVLKLPN